MRLLLSTTIGVLSVVANVYAVDAGNKTTLKACTVAWPPYTIVQNNDVSGIDPDTVKELTKRMGYGLQVNIVPWERCLKLSASGDVDIVFVGSKKPDREQTNHYLQTPMHKIAYIPVIKTGAQYQWDQNKDYSKLPQPIGIPLGFSVASEIKNAKVDQGAIDDKQNCQKLKAGRVATVVMTAEAAHYYAKENNMVEQITLLTPPVDAEKEYYIMVSKASKNIPNSAEFTQQADTTLKAMIADGTIASIASRYTGH